MNPVSRVNVFRGATGVLVSALLVSAPTLCQANLVYQIDALQTFDTDGSSLSGFVIWDESLSAITDWHIETTAGFGVHNIATDGAVFDAGGSGDSMIGSETTQTFYTTSPANEPHEFEIIWDTSPADAAFAKNWSITETWTIPSFPGVHWRTGSITASLISPVPLPASVWLLASGLFGLFRLAKRRSGV